MAHPLLPILCKPSILKGALSDHSPIALEVDLGLSRPNWCLNISLYNHPVGMFRLKAHVHTYLENNDGSVDSALTMWEVKAIIRGQVMREAEGGASVVIEADVACLTRAYITYPSDITRRSFEKMRIDLSTMKYRHYE